MLTSLRHPSVYRCVLVSISRCGDDQVVGPTALGVLRSHRDVALRDGINGGGWGLVLLEVFSYPRDATVPFTLGSHQHPTLPCCPSYWTPMLLVPTLLLTEHCTQFKYCCFNNLRPVAVQREDKPAVFPVPPRLLTLVSLLLQNSPHIMDLGSCRPHLDLILLIILNIKHNATAPLVLL